MENSGLSPRQNKFASLIQKEIAILLQKQIREKGLLKLLISVTKVNITADLSIAKIYLSIYPSSQAKKVLESIQKNSFKIKHNLALILKNQIRKIPNINFFIDDSLDYIENIDNALKSKDNPIKYNFIILNIPFLIAKRYFFSKSKQKAINIINMISLSLIVISSASLIIVLSGFSGLKDYGLSFSNSFDPENRILPKTGKTFLID